MYQTIKKLLGIVVLGLLFLKPLNSKASEFNGLDGIQSFNLVVGVSSEECEVTSEKIENSIKYILSPTQIKLDKSSPTVLYLETTIMYDPVGCFARYGLTAFEWQAGNNSANRKIISPVLLWETGSSLKGAPDRFSKRLINSIENATKSFVVDWSERNK